MREDFEYVVIIEFDDVEGLTRVSRRIPKHAAIGGHFMQASAAALAYDYEMVDLESARPRPVDAYRSRQESQGYRAAAWTAKNS